MQIFIKSIFHGKTFVANVEPSDSIENLKSKFDDDEINILHEEIKVMYGGKYLQDSKSLSEQNIQDLDTVQFIFIPQKRIQRKSSSGK